MTSGGRGVGSEVACLDESSRGRERHGIQRRDALIPETEEWTLRVRNKFHDWTSKVNLHSRVFRVRSRLPACGWRFGLGLVAYGSDGHRPLFCFFSVGSTSGRRKGTDPKKTAVIRNHFMAGVPLLDVLGLWFFVSDAKSRRASWLFAS